jgi:hypothetical protein
LLHHTIPCSLLLLPSFLLFVLHLWPWSVHACRPAGYLGCGRILTRGMSPVLEMFPTTSLSPHTVRMEPNTTCLANSFFDRGLMNYPSPSYGNGMNCWSREGEESPVCGTSFCALCQGPKLDSGN